MEKPLDARVEIAVEGCPIETRWHVGANARYGRGEFWLAGRKKCEVPRWHYANVGLAR